MVRATAARSLALDLRPGVSNEFMMRRLKVGYWEALGCKETKKKKEKEKEKEKKRRAG